MNAIGNIITAVGAVITAITLFYKAFCSNKQQSLANLIEQEEKEIKQKSQDAELYRKRWLKAEKENDRLRKELNEKNDN